MASPFFSTRSMYPLFWSARRWHITPFGLSIIGPLIALIVLLDAAEPDAGHLQELDAGRVLFKEGESDKRTIYLVGEHLRHEAVGLLRRVAVGPGRRRDRLQRGGAEVGRRGVELGVEAGEVPEDPQLLVVELDLGQVDLGLVTRHAGRVTSQATAATYDDDGHSGSEDQETWGTALGARRYWTLTPRQSIGAAGNSGSSRPSFSMTMQRLGFRNSSPRWRVKSKISSMS